MSPFAFSIIVSMRCCNNFCRGGLTIFWYFKFFFCVLSFT